MSNTLILNRDTFELPVDGWYQVAPLGEFPHQPTGVVQVVDKAACDAMTNAFQAEATKPNFAGLLIDFDHFSLDDKLKSEAAGWITELQNRGDGLWAKIRWSDVGEECVKGGRYRFLSPVWSRKDCDDLGNGRLRPVRLLNAAVTNDPNLKGMVPLSNRKTGGNADGVQRLKWVLGSNDDHCPSCSALAGQVHTKAQWDSAAMNPGGAGLYCGDSCQCSLVETEEPETGALGTAPKRKGEKVKNTSRKEAQTAQEAQVLANIGWTDEARAAALAVRRAKAAARKAGREAGKEDKRKGQAGKAPEQQEPEEDSAEWSEAAERYFGEMVDWINEEGPGVVSESTLNALLDRLSEKQRTGRNLTDAEKDLLQSMERDAPVDAWATDYEGWFEDEGLASMTPEAVEGLTDTIRKRLTEGTEDDLSAAELGFLHELAKTEYAGQSDGDPIFQWIERWQSTGGGYANRWSDEARAAALEVRRAKARRRAGGKSESFAPGEPHPGAPREKLPPPRPGMPFPHIPREGDGWTGGSPYFDERLGRYVYPLPAPPAGYPVEHGLPWQQAGLGQPGVPKGVLWSPEMSLARQKQLYRKRANG